jgi:hypothetical protein
MFINDAIGGLGVQLTRELSRSALPHAPAVADRRPHPGSWRIRTAGVLRRVADRIGPIDGCHAPRAGVSL